MKTLRSKRYEFTRSILNPRREYVPASRTDVRETFAKAREQIALEQKRRAA